MSNRLINWFSVLQSADLLPFGGEADPRVLDSGRRFWSRWAVAEFFVAPTDATQGEGLPHHLCPRPGVLDVNVHLRRHGRLGRTGLSLNARLSSMMAQALAPTGR